MSVNYRRNARKNTRPPFHSSHKVPYLERKRSRRLTVNSLHCQDNGHWHPCLPSCNTNHYADIETETSRNDHHVVKLFHCVPSRHVPATLNTRSTVGTQTYLYEPTVTSLICYCLLQTPAFTSTDANPLCWRWFLHYWRCHVKCLSIPPWLAGDAVGLEAVDEARAVWS